MKTDISRLTIPILFIQLLLTIVVFPSICFSEMKTVEGEYCKIYLGDMKDKFDLMMIRNLVRDESIKDGLRKLDKNNLEYQTSLNNIHCMSHISDQYLNKVVVVRHTEKNRKICNKVKITVEPELIYEFLKKSGCPPEVEAPAPPLDAQWVEDVYFSLRSMGDNINMGLIVEIKIKDLQENNRDILVNEEEKDFFTIKDMSNYKLIDRRHLSKVLEEQKLSSSGLTDSDTVKIGKLLKLDVIILRLIYEDSNVTKVLKVDTGEVLLFRTYKTVKNEKMSILNKEPDSKVWEFISGNYYYNRNSITKSSNIISGWSYWIISDDQRKEMIEIFKKYDLEKASKYQYYDHIVQLFEIDCKKKKLRFKESIDYDEQGNVLDNNREDNPEWKSIVPESVGEELYKKLCVSPKKK